MSAEIFYIFGYLLFVLLLWTIPFFRKIFVEHKAELFTFSSGYIFLLADIKSNDESCKVILDMTWKELNPWLITVGIILGLISIIMTYLYKKRQQNIDSLTRALKVTQDKFNLIKQEYFKLCSDHIKEVFDDFFDQSNGCGRVSLYKHEGNSFKLLGRYSNNPIYNKAGREEYPDNEGFIAKGWENEHYQISGIPKWSGNGRKYSTFVKANCDIADNTLRTLPMKSCSFYIHRFNNDNAQNPHGIIVLEQLKSDVIPLVLINKILDEHEKQIIFLLKSMKSLN
jgi:hypothetical protein